MIRLSVHFRCVQIGLKTEARDFPPLNMNAICILHLLSQSLIFFIHIRFVYLYCRQNHLDDHIVERTALPNELIRNVQGQLAFEEENPRVWPINHFPDQSINSASSSLVQKHSNKFPTERILMQVYQ